MSHKPKIYLDNASTTKIDPEVLKAMLAYFKEKFWNPSSRYRLGLEVSQAIEEARSMISKLFLPLKRKIIFTSGGTEANSLAILGTLPSKKDIHIITTNIEHPSVYETFLHLKQIKERVSFISVKDNGIIDPADIEAEIRAETKLVSVMYVNNEIGTIQPIDKIGNIIKRKAPRCIFHVDAVQGALKLPFFPHLQQADLITISAHKIHGPKGIGALIARPDISLKPIMYGGDQEYKLRPGTENVPAIIGFAKAIEIGLKEMDETNKRLQKMRDMFLDYISEKIPHLLINGSITDRVCNNINVSVPDIPSEVILYALEQEGIFVSQGSACHSKRKGQSHVIKALGRDSSWGTVRISFSKYNTFKEIELGAKIFVRTISRLFDEIKR
jgi:cysteine desulfurase